MQVTSMPWKWREAQPAESYQINCSCLPDPPSNARLQCKNFWKLQEHFVGKPVLNCNKDFRGVGTLSHMIALQHSYIVKGDQCQKEYFLIQYYSMIVWSWNKVNFYISAFKPLPRFPNSSK